MIEKQLIEKLRDISNGGPTNTLTMAEKMTFKNFCREHFRFSINTGCPACLKKHAKKALPIIETQQEKQQ